MELTAKSFDGNKITFEKVIPETTETIEYDYEEIISMRNNLVADLENYTRYKNEEIAKLDDLLEKANIIKGETDGKQIIK